MNLSFAGCGFLGLYHVGVASCFKEYAPQILVDKIAGASAGALAACCLICNVPLGESTTDVLKIAVKARARALGPFHPGFDINGILHDGLVNMFPDDVHLRSNGRLHVSVTRVSDGENVLLTQFDSKEDLIQALLCSCFIPFYTGILPPKFHGVAYMDGGFSDNVPILDENTITVSPFSGESDICPQDSSFSIMQISLANTKIAITPSNLYRVTRILFPPHPDILSKMCQQGFDDALKFLQRYNLISCMRCLEVQSSFTVAEADSSTENDSIENELEHAYDGCVDCHYRKQMALLDSLPESVVKAIKNASDQVNKGVINWLFRHQPVKVLSFLSLPYVLPVDIVIVIFFKFSCQLAITEYDYNRDEETLAYPTCHQSLKSNEAFSSKLVNDLELGRVKRKSYAGLQGNPLPIKHQRRRSIETDMYVPERVISTMNLGFTVNLENTVETSKSKKQNVMDAFKSFGRDHSEFNAIDITNKALSWDLSKYQGSIDPQNGDNFEHILETTSKHEALMAFYYMDEKMQVKVTEIFNINDSTSKPVTGYGSVWK
ncbi:1-acylglycerol-3-phosphate O-acyltransferase Pnpla3-like isoform X2 [Tachypleus tridentatus]|uniref:1-acylglycerol-3-phosphate O-acyltransferase Pnpla3-like isoform X2 n=1 Tax=Tachypleus tridentatus TaxID=6853 RepID=UPI003FD51B49